MSALMLMLLVSLGPIMTIFMETDDEDVDETPAVEDQTLTGSAELMTSFKAQQATTALADLVVLTRW
jgi:hypothetical protein